MKLRNNNLVILDVFTTPIVALGRIANIMTKEFFLLILSLRMCSDPWPLSAEEMRDFDWCLDQKARDFGYQDWIDAYHQN